MHLQSASGKCGGGRQKRCQLCRLFGVEVMIESKERAEGAAGCIKEVARHVVDSVFCCMCHDGLRFKILTCQQYQGVSLTSRMPVPPSDSEPEKQQEG